MSRQVVLVFVLLSLIVAGSGMATAQEATPGSTLPVWGYEVVAEYPHDPDAFTQGLDFEDGQFIEGTGLEGRSSLRRVEIGSGVVLQQVDLPDDQFGEGVTALGDRIYQITWLTGTCYVYDRETFTLEETFRYETEGWGLTTDGSLLVMSDGSDRIVYRDPETFDEVRHIDVRAGGAPVTYLNELEWVNGELWANVWQTDRIARIDPNTGEVTGWIDLAGLLPEAVDLESVDVLNGIAYDAETGRIFVTGKLWPMIFEIELVPRD